MKKTCEHKIKYVINSRLCCPRKVKLGRARETACNSLRFPSREKKITGYLDLHNRQIAAKNINTIIDLSLDWYKIREVEEMNT